MCALSCVRLSATPWTVARQAPLSMGSPRQEYCSGLPFPSPGDLLHPGIEPVSLACLALAGDSLPLCHLLFLISSQADGGLSEIYSTECLPWKDPSLKERLHNPMSAVKFQLISPNSTLPLTLFVGEN